MSDTSEVRPFNIAVSDKDLELLSAKLSLTRLPDELDLPPEQAWGWGMPLAILKPVVEYWRTQYNWRAVEERLNKALPQFTTHTDSREHGPQEVHFVHKRSESSTAIPLLFIHGWPGNFLEVSKMIDGLTSPTDPKHPSFHVVAPSYVCIHVLSCRAISYDRFLSQESPDLYSRNVQTPPEWTLKKQPSYSTSLWLS
ncbi:hypothetical protein FS749_016339 [Ceratobasidium sp. UAMH 11750]|nr:hypothetical protein FS749_016339 [Ceratobasidium sp. UAMH 11750]